ncbi:MAG: maleylpyruvate isomerase family mycothiol-dependent enzyme [Acidimicrobiales bacterium]
MDPTLSGGLIATAVRERHRELTDNVANLEADALCGPSRLPRWDRLTIICHLRYGALASHRLTDAALTGREAAYYPQGRQQQRPATLRPADGESMADVVASFTRHSQRLDEAWATVSDEQWPITIREPPGNQDLGPVTLGTIALLRLTEVEVHGHDLDLGLSPWSETFVAAALPMRLQWLPTRRSNHHATNQTIDATWLLATTGGPDFLVRAQCSKVEVSATENGADADATISGTARQLLAFILGREPLDKLTVGGDIAVAHSFLAAFPAP